MPGKFTSDVHQMQPYVESRHKELPAVCGARGMMSILTQIDSVPQASLVTTFRAHPAINDLHNAVTYRGQLVSGTPAHHRSALLNRVRCLNQDVPLVFIEVEGSSIRLPTGSHHNEQELQVYMSLITFLLQRGFVSDQICILSFYKEPPRRLEAVAQQHHIEVATVDSIQGREVDIVVVLITRTNIREDTAEFIDDRLRINVALTRHGLFILGHVPLCRHPPWGAVTRWVIVN
ncbi:hypothetical protein Q1695_009657 [Nippostrongylus brasiliensis]|nr:hypothetical protein Q1695_009657 [Nippostrongylus brasiliensis]